LAEKIPGVICPSVLPPKPVKGGAHHVVSVDKPLYNMSACVDMMLAGRAREFTSTCPRSAFSDLINHGRKTGWEGFGGSGRPREPDLKKCLWNQHSQNGEDGVLAEIISRMNIRNGSFFEAGAWDGIHLSNTRRLVGLGWTGVMCEGDKSRIVDLEHNIRHTRGVKILERFLTPENMDLTLAECGLPEDFDVFSLDIDSCDYQCWKGMSRFRPKIVIIEIEPRADSNEDYVQGDGKPSLRGTDYHGTGFGPMVELGISKGYVLAAHIACNLVFVRNDYCEAAGIPTDVDPYSLFNDRWFLNSRVR